jgi:ankyrin repeat protein
MGSLPISEIPYIAAMNGDWKSMIGYYQEHFEFLYSPVTLSLDTGFHLAVHSNAERPLKDLLEIMGVVEFLTETRNKFGNTVLHEATIYGNYEAVVLLVERCPDLISILNDFGETPLFTAAAFGEAKIVEYLIETRPEKCVDCNGRILSIHRQRSKDGRSILRQRSKDGLSILGAAIIGQHFGNNYSSLYIILNFKKCTHIYKTLYNFSIPNFMNAETALLLLELDESLHDLEDKMGRTALQLLAEMPTGFESGYPMGICERLIYCCMPTPITLL